MGHTSQDEPTPIYAQDIRTPSKRPQPKRHGANIWSWLLGILSVGCLLAAAIAPPKPELSNPAATTRPAPPKDRYLGGWGHRPKEPYD